MGILAKFVLRCGSDVRNVAAAFGLLIALTAPPVVAAPKPTEPPPAYSYFVTGTQYFESGTPKPVLRPLPKTTPQAIQPVVVMGGGPDVDEAFRWMIQQAGITPSTGGRFVVIRATGTDAYDPYFYYSDANNSTTTPAVDGFVGGAHLGLTSAETLIITSRAGANDPFVNAVVSTANALWIAGGDQADYILQWKGTALESTIATLLANNVPVGGTSAGANVLGHFVFSALNGTVTSKEALKNPYDNAMTLDPTPFSASSFLNVPALKNTFVDPHFDARDRMGRLVAFVSRTIAPGTGEVGCPGGILTPTEARGIGVDVETALLIQNASGRYVARRVTNVSTTSTSAVHFLRPTTSPAPCAPGKPLTMSTVLVQRLADSALSFDLTGWWNGGDDPNVPNYIVNETAGNEDPNKIPY